MANNTIKETIKKSLNNLAVIDQNIIENITKNLQTWNNLGYSDLKFGYDEIIEVISVCIEKNILDDLPFSTINQISTYLINIHTYYSQLINSQVQPVNILNSYHSLQSQIDVFRIFLRNNGIYVYVKLSPDIPGMQNSIQTQLSTITDAQGRINLLETDTMSRIKNLENEIKSLISPAVAGSLSKSFSNRKIFIFRTRLVFLIMTIVSLCLVSWYTITTVQQIFFDFSIENLDKLSMAYTIFRIFTLFPLYLIIGFLYKQYSRERTVEENYAHKETIATIIKTYGELITDQKVKDELLQNASKVIVSSPEKHKYDRQAKNSDSLDIQSLVNNLIDLIGKKE